MVHFQCGIVLQMYMYQQLLLLEEQRKLLCVVLLPIMSKPCLLTMGCSVSSRADELKQSIIPWFHTEFLVW